MPLLVKTVSLRREFMHGGSSTLAVRDASLELLAGESVAITGPSGCGKTTLLNMIGLILPSTSGKIFSQDTDVDSFSAAKRAHYRNSYFGFIVQDFALIEDYTVQQNVELPLLYGERTGTKERKMKIHEALNMVGFNEKHKHKVKTLSGGQRQRVAIARALVNNPQVILADEPTGSLDSSTGSEVTKLLMDLAAYGKALLLVTHNAELANQCKRRLTMMDGLISEEPLVDSRVLG